MFSRVFPVYHTKKGEPTFFVEKILKSINSSKIQSKLIVQDALSIFNSENYLGCNPKNHTIRSGNRFKKGDFFSPRVWSDKPYKSKQIILFEDVEVLKVWNIEIDENKCFYIEGKLLSVGYEKILASNDGLSIEDLESWFSKLPFSGQIICWSDSVLY